MGRNGVARGNINLQGRNHPVKLRFHADADARILCLIHNLRNAFHSENNTILNRRRNDVGHDVFDFFHTDRRALDGRVQVHSRACIQPHHSGNQHTALENELVTVFRKRNALQETLHHVVAHEKLCICRFGLGEIAN